MDRAEYYIEAADRYPIATIDTIDGQEERKDAALIAAAPDLYEMLKAIDDWWRAGNQPLSPHALITDRSETKGIAELVRTAIAKAEGGQQ